MESFYVPGSRSIAMASHRVVLIGYNGGDDASRSRPQATSDGT
jgi:hypothetical protein